MGTSRHWCEDLHCDEDTGPTSCGRRIWAGKSWISSVCCRHCCWPVWYSWSEETVGGSHSGRCLLRYWHYSFKRAFLNTAQFPRFVTSNQTGMSALPGNEIRCPGCSGLAALFWLPFGDNNNHFQVSSTVNSFQFRTDIFFRSRSVPT